MLQKTLDNNSKREVLRCLLPGSEITKLPESLGRLDPETLSAFLLQNGLASLWADFMESGHQDMPEAFSYQVKSSKMHTAALQSTQLVTIKEIDAMFAGAGLPYLVFKGFNHAWSLYSRPHLRPCSDIDVLVPEDRRNESIKQLADAGFIISPDSNTISHEILAQKQLTDIDLHWQILRPGRTRININDYLFNHLQRRENFNGLSDQASLLVMLTHPVFSKYLDSPASLLVHMMDLHLLLRKREINWTELGETLRQSGLQVAAWCSLYWYRYLTADPSINEFMETLQPGKLRRTYLQYWIDNRLAWRYWQHKWLVKTLFGLVIHDTLPDAWTALQSLRREKANAETQLREIQTIITFPP